MAKTLTVYLAADIGKFKKELREADRQTQGFAGGLSDKLGPALLAAGAAAGAVALKVGADAIQMGSAFEQAAGAADQLFGQNGSAAAQAWADSTSTSMGLSMQAAIDAQNAFGAFALQAGKTGEEAVGWTQQLTTAAADLSAAFGGDVTEAVQAMASAFRGSGEPLEKYGVIITQNAVNAEAAALGFEKVAGSFDQQAKVLATTSLIQKQMDLLGVTGQNAREADTFAGATSRVTAQLEDLQTILGLGILDGMDNFGTSANDMSDALVKLEPLVRKTGESIGSTISDYILLTGAIVDLVDAANDLGDSFGPLGALFDAVGTTIYRWANPVSYTLDVFGRGEEAVSDFGVAAKNTGGAARAAAPAIKAAGDAASAAGSQASGASVKFASLGAAMAAVGGSTFNWRKEINGAGQGLEAIVTDRRYEEWLQRYQAGLDNVSKATGGSTKAVETNTKALDLWKAKITDSIGALSDQVREVEKAAKKVDDYASSIQNGLLGGIDLKEVFNAEDAQGTVDAFVKQIGDVTAFSTSLADLGTRLPNSPGAQMLLGEILNLGAATGTQFITALSDETAANLVNQLDAAITATEGNAYLLGRKFYEEGVNAAVQTMDGMIANIEKQEKKLKKIGRNMGQPIGAEIKGQIAAAIDGALADASAAVSRWQASNRITVPRTSVNT